MTRHNHITVFEHQIIKLGQVIGEAKFDEDKLKALVTYFGEKGVPYYSLIKNGVRFNEYVGVIQVGNVVIEVLPKADKKPDDTSNESEESQWQKILIGMLRAVGSFDIKSTSESNLKIKSNNILDLYFEMFITEVEYLLHNGLLKKYRKKEGNVTTLKGSLIFAKQIQQNLTHQERFYVRHTTYDVEHLLHFILFKAIQLLKHINTNTTLHARIGALLLFFPEMPDIKVSETTFNKLIFNRKTQAYKKAIEIAKLLLLQYHPDVSRGRNHVLALMFDMNLLWEQFIYVCLRKNKPDNYQIAAQTTKNFWSPKSDTYSISRIKPDIIIKDEKEKCLAVLDTKWKNLNGKNPSPEDLRQMYVYHEYYNANKVALIYPGKYNITDGFFAPTSTFKENDKHCAVINIEVIDNIKEWQRSIAHFIFDEFILKTQ